MVKGNCFKCGKLEDDVYGDCSECNKKFCIDCCDDETNNCEGSHDYYCETCVCKECYPKCFKAGSEYCDKCFAYIEKMNALKNIEKEKILKKKKRKTIKNKKLCDI